MRLSDRSLHAWTATFYAALGLTPVVACGGTVVEQSDGGSASGGHSSGGLPAGGAGGGTSTGGRVISDGGTTSAGGRGAGGFVNVDGGTTSAGGTVINVGGTRATGGAAGVGGGLVPCIPETDAGTLGGYETCQGGVLHRTKKAECPSSIPRPGIIVPSTGGAPSTVNQCQRDADCTEKPHGFCEPGTQILAGFCSYGCIDDSECMAGQICACGDPIGRCTNAACTVDSECATGLCASYVPAPGCPGIAFACQSEADTCLSDADCALAACNYDAAKKARFCDTLHCSVGRPFLVGGAARLAAAVERTDFRSELRPDVRALDAGARDAIGAYWTDIGLMEHASVAAFARFALELSSMGAPAELLAATDTAILDEIAHARDAFALAGEYAGRNLGPGALDFRDALAGRSPLDVVRTAILEGCIGETVAAVAASEALAGATDPAVRAALTRVVPDETRHAELAWRFVRWVVSDGPAALRSRAATELVETVEQALADAGAALAAPADVHAALAVEAHDGKDELRAHGVLTPRDNAEVRLRVLEDVVAPCARALLASVQRGAVMPVAAGAMPTL
ncbi:MAG TPA: ferritin-like domain-containing protein [Polyangiaceae bacterium]|jgi:hypothetical protein|nr:ferritin-like domain-containing protein [Polyangiaceae bacterium]